MKDRILFVDDDMRLLASYKRQFRKQYQVETVIGGREALELIEQNAPYAVIISDYQMPYMDGIEFLSRVREIVPDTVRIMLTGSADMQAAIQAVNEGNIFRFLTKPCSAEVLGESLKTGIEKYQQVTREREYNKKTRHSMARAMEIQQHLIPKAEPVIEGLDISGRCIYCDETGGDYYDFLDRGNGDNGKICVLVGDVSEHGISSALLMTSARAFFRERSLKPGNIASVVADVNRQIAQDVEMSNEFMTLFYSEVDAKNKQFRWVRAGHEPAILYDPDTDSFKELKGRGLPLGIMEDTEYRECEIQLSSGQIIVISTDGISESCASDGTMFGKDRLRDKIRDNAARSAKGIVSALMEDFQNFINPLPQQDDATLVVIKVQDTPS